MKTMSKRKKSKLAFCLFGVLINSCFNGLNDKKNMVGAHYLINLYKTVICLQCLIIMTTENIYICTVSKSRHNNHKVMYS